MFLSSSSPLHSSATFPWIVIFLLSSLPKAPLPPHDHHVDVATATWHSQFFFNAQLSISDLVSLFGEIDEMKIMKKVFLFKNKNGALSDRESFRLTCSYQKKYNVTGMRKTTSPNSSSRLRHWDESIWMSWKVWLGLQSSDRMTTDHFCVSRHLCPFGPAKEKLNPSSFIDCHSIVLKKPPCCVIIHGRICHFSGRSDGGTVDSSSSSPCPLWR